MATAEHPASPEALRAALAGSSPADLVLLAAHALRLGSLDYAAAVCETWSGPDEPALSLSHAAALFGLGEQSRAIGLVEAVLAAQPDHLAALFYLAQMSQHSARPERATALLLQLLERSADFPGALGALASLRMPGPSYRDVLKRLHELVRPRSYLEVGVESGATLALAHAAERAVGVDPDASKLRRELVPPCARVFHEASDAFFERSTPEAHFGARRVDFGFIDGMHLFEYALRDFINVEAWSQPEGVIVLHDCLPVWPGCASRERQTKFWVGDVWKVVPILREYRPGLRVKLIATAPSALCVVRGLEPSSRVLAAALPEIIERFVPVEYPARALEVPDGFELVPASEQGLRDALG